MTPQRPFWTSLAGICVTAIVASVPILMSGVMDRGIEIMKLSVAAPLAVLALGAALLSGEGKRWAEHSAVSKIAAGSLILFLVIAAVSAAFSDNPQVATFGEYYRREGVLTWWIYGALFFAVLTWAHRPDRIAGVLDALLLASVIPVTYALEQRFDLNFFLLNTRDLARPGGTLGNPVFLAAYLALLLPITGARCWQTRRQPRLLALWSVVALLQMTGLLVTQTRGPLLALLIGLLMLACLAAAYARARCVLLSAIVLLAGAFSSILAINMLPAAGQRLQDVPVIGRMVIRLDRVATGAPTRATRSVAARLGLWQTGVETFAAAPLPRQLIGYGPESAYLNYFSHLPALVMQVDDYAASKTYDRLHADTLDIGLNFGLIGWLAYCLFFGSVVYAAARSLFGFAGRAWVFFSTMVVGGAAGAAAAVLTGFASAALPAFGLGIGAGWYLFLLTCAWRSIKHGVSAGAGPIAGHWALLASLTIALIGFWLDAQINIPVLTTRLISFLIAALILVIAGEMSRTIAASESESESDSACRGESLWISGVALTFVAACASFLPMAIFDSPAGDPDKWRWLPRLLPLLSFLPFVAWAGWALLRDTGRVNRAVANKSLAVAAALSLFYPVCHFAVMVRADAAAMHLDQVQQISISSYLCALYIFAMCVLFALLASSRATPATSASSHAIAPRISALVLAALVLMVAIVNWRTLLADVASALSHRTVERQPALSEQLVEIAIRTLPHERYYQRQSIFNLLGRAVADIRQLGKSPERYSAVERNLTMAERQARETLKQFPRDPWSVVALANVLQVRGLNFLRPADPVAGSAAAKQADELFSAAHQMFPAQPLILRNWAQLRFDQGNVQGAFALLDAMEKLIPNELDAYVERIIMAAEVSDTYVIWSVLARARPLLETRLYEELLRVAKAQQK